MEHSVYSDPTAGCGGCGSMTPDGHDEDCYQMQPAMETEAQFVAMQEDLIETPAGRLGFSRYDEMTPAQIAREDAAYAEWDAAMRDEPRPYADDLCACVYEKPCDLS